jgi:hypothetical protein
LKIIILLRDYILYGGIAQAFLMKCISFVFILLLLFLLVLFLLYEVAAASSSRVCLVNKETQEDPKINYSVSRSFHYHENVI